MESTHLRLRGERNHEKYVLPNKLAGFFDLIVASSTTEYGPMRFEGNRAEEVAEHRRQFFKDAGAWIEGAIFMDQIHGDHIVTVTGRDAGKGAVDPAKAIAQTDGLITSEPKLFLSVVTADCAPVVFYDERLHAIGCAHAGWKGTIARIPQKIAARMQEEFGSQPTDLHVYVGPSITSSCYNVEQDRAQLFVKEFGPHVIEERDGKLFLSLQTAIQIQLEQAGVPEKQIECSDICTSCEHQRFPSSRFHKEALNDRLITTIGLSR